MTTDILQPVHGTRISPLPAVSVETPLAKALKAERRHIPALDGVRGLALLIVMTLHFTFGVEGFGPASKTILSFIRTGWLGVDLFFVLSGYLITGILLDTRDDPHRVRNFYARRSLRIFPLYYGFLTAYFLIGPHLNFQRERIAEAAKDQIWLWTYCANILICIKGSFIVPSVNHFWSLAVEEHFYLVWPALVWICSQRGLARLCVGAMVLALVSRISFYAANVWTEAPYSLTICRLDSLAMGGLLALGARSPGGLRPYTRHAIVAIVVAAIFIVGFVIPSPENPKPWIESLVFTFSAFGFGGLLILVLNASSDSRFNRAFSFAPLRLLGFYSYGLYVFHHPLRLAMEHVYSFERLGEKVHSYYLGVFLHAIICFVLSLGIALASYHLYEKQFLKLKRFFEAPRRPVNRIPVP